LKLEKYQKEIEKSLKVGTERSLYQPFGNFTKDFISQKYKREISTIAEQSSKNYRKGVGFPDITIKEGDFAIGYIEIKLPKDNLNDKRFKEQFDRYKNSLENIIFTNLNVWQLFQWDNEKKAIKVKEVIFEFENPSLDELKKIFDLFLEYEIKGATSSQELAINLAKKTQLLSNMLNQLLEVENSDLLQTKESFKKSLLHDISDRSFSNLLSETFTYSLFISTLQHFESGKSDNLTLTTAMDYIPRNIPILYDLYNLSNSLSREIDEVREIVELILKELNLADIEKIRNSFYSETSEKDPILNFYEPFLNAYDPATKKERGAFYTPKPVVDFIVRETDNILKNEFNLENGFLEKGVKVLDPATGTGTFLHSLIELVKRKIDENFKPLGMEKEEFLNQIRDHILKDFYGFELMIAPYTVAHLKLSILLKNLSFELSKDERFQIYLANTLDDPSKEPVSLFGFGNITKESRKAKEIKNEKNIIAIIGNPPYSGTSQNPSKEGKNLTWIGNQIEKYKFNDNKKLDEKNPKWLQDDYVKFIRFAQYQIEQKGSGVISYIVPHGFLDNPTFRYMRKSLLDNFSKIYLIDLHGNTTKKEKTLDGGKDENIFDIKQGVTLMFLVKLENK
jgi:type I restriction-modification system DNA methylase subunit